MSSAQMRSKELPNVLVEMPAVPNVESATPVLLKRTKRDRMGHLLPNLPDEMTPQAMTEELHQ